jgi:hypothetical protein
MEGCWEEYSKQLHECTTAASTGEGGIIISYTNILLMQLITCNMIYTVGGGIEAMTYCISKLGNNNTLLCYSTTLLLCYSTTLLLYYYSTTLLLYYSTTTLLLYYYSTTLLLYYYSTTLLLYYSTTTLLLYYSTTLLLYYSTTLLLLLGL